jgi:Plasmid pRiA4b ORF-3-like protein
MDFSNRPILNDFNRFLDYLVQHPNISLTKDKGVLTTKDLMAIDNALHFKALMVTPKSQMKAYSVITTFFYAASAAQMILVKKDTAKRTASLSIHPNRIQQYDALNDVEKYFSLLESFWCYVNWDTAFDCRSFGDDHFYEKILSYPVGKLVTIQERELKRDGQICCPFYTFAAEIFEAFGFLNMVWDKKLEKRPSSYVFPYKMMSITELGKALLPILLDKRPAYAWHNLDPFNDNDKYEYEEDDDDDDDDFDFDPPFSNDEKQEKIESIPENNPSNDFTNKFYEELYAPNNEKFVDAFLPVLNGLTIEKALYPIERVKIEGVYLLKVSLDKDLHRVLAVGHDQTFEDLHLAIQNAFAFDNDHLYAFFMNGERWSQSGDRFYADESLRHGMDGNKPASVYCIGEVGLYLGMQFLYLYDFGSEWHFNISVMAIETGVKIPKAIKVVESVGEAPKEYGDDEWDEDDD